MTLLSSMLLGIGILLAGIVLSLIVIPIHIVAEAELDDFDANGVVELWWCWGLVGLRLLPSAEAEVTLLGRIVHRRSLKASKSGERKEKKKKKRQRADPKVFFEHRETVLHILKRFTTALEPDAVIWGHIGLGSPDHTAYLNFILRELAAAAPRIQLDIAPNYVDQSILIRGVLRVFVWPAQLIGVAVELIARRETRQLIQALR